MPLAIRKRGKFWHVRGVVPMRQADGSITTVRIEESTRETGEAKARRAADRIWDYYTEQAYRPKAKVCPSFTDAALTYVETKQPSKRDRGFIKKLVAQFRDTPIDELDQAAVADAANRLYPGKSAATHVRAVWSPVACILRLSGVRPDYSRPSVGRSPIAVPPEKWFDAVLPLCPPRLGALLVFLTLTGRRVTEALDAELDHDGKTVTIPRAKSGRSVSVELPTLCIKLLKRAEPSPSRRLFGYADRHNVYRILKPICKRAGVPFYGTHSFGRHAFATRLLKEGWSVKHVAAGGGWDSPRMVLERYGHLEQSEVASDVKERGERWGKKRKILSKTAGKG